MRGIAPYLIASQNTVPGSGFAYKEFLQSLVNAANLPAGQLAASIVETYKNRYENTDPDTTLAVVKTDGVTTLAENVSSFANTLSNALSSSVVREALEEARKNCGTFNSSNDGGMTSERNESVDLHCFLKQLIEIAPPSVELNLAETIVQQLESDELVTYRYAGANRSDAMGLSIFYPSNRLHFAGAPDVCYYCQYNRSYSIEFVESFQWDEFLYAYSLVGIPPKSQLDATTATRYYFCESEESMCARCSVFHSDILALCE